MAKPTVDPIILGPARLAFPALAEPDQNNKYVVTLLFLKSDPMAMDQIMQARRLLHAQARLAWGQDTSKWHPRFRSLDFKTYLSPDGRDGWPIRDGDAVTWDGFAGHLFVKASSQFAPGIVDARRQPVLNPATDVPAGLIVRCQVNAWDYDNSGNKGLSFGLLNLQIVRDDGVRFGGRAQKAEDVFDALEADDDMSADNPANYAQQASNDDW